MGAHAEDAGDQRFGQHLLGRACGHDLALLQHGQVVAEHRCQIEIVQRDDGGEAEFGDQGQDIELMLDIEMVGRLVEQQFAWGLGQRPGDMHPLPLAARQCLPELAGAFAHVDAGECFFDRGIVIGCPGGEEAAMRRAAEADDIAHCELRIRRRLLLDESDAAGKDGARKAGDIIVAEADDAGSDLPQPADQAQQAGFAGAVRAEQAEHLALFDRYADAIDDDGIAGGIGDLVD